MGNLFDIPSMEYVVEATQKVTQENQISDLELGKHSLYHDKVDPKNVTSKNEHFFSKSSSMLPVGYGSELGPPRNRSIEHRPPSTEPPVISSGLQAATVPMVVPGNEALWSTNGGEI